MSEPQLSLFPNLTAPPAPRPLPATPDLASYDVILVSTSAGKDSQETLRRAVLAADAAGVRHRVVAVHCNLAEEWPGTAELAQRQCDHWGVRLELVRREDTILDYTLRRHRQAMGKYAPWPRPDARWCTSDFKRGPTLKVFTRLTDEVRGTCRPPWPGLELARWCTSDFKRGPVRKLMTSLVNETLAVQLSTKRTRKLARKVRILHCMGMRAQESPNREKLLPFDHDSDASNKTRRHVDTWLPVHHLTTEDIWTGIRESGVPYHPIYDRGMSRLSCTVCIFAPRSQLHLVAHLAPDVLQAYADVERRVRFTFRKDLSLQEVLEEARHLTLGQARAAAAGDTDGCWNM